MNSTTFAATLLAIGSAASLPAQELRHVGYRAYGGAVYDPVRQRVIVPDSSGYSREWDGTAWHRGTDAGSDRGYCYMDTAANRLVLAQEYGYGSGPAFIFRERFGNEWQSMAVAGGPTNRWGTSLAYDQQRGELVAFGGYDGMAGAAVGETWLFDGSSWQQRDVLGPTAGSYSAMTYDSGRQRVVLFGGHDGTGVLGGTWEWDGAAWSQVATANAPPARWFGAMTYDSARGVVVMGCGSATIPFADLWEYDGIDWQQRATPPIPIGANSSRMVYDAARAETLLLGWRDSHGWYGDVLAWDGAQWSNRPGLGLLPWRLSGAAGCTDHNGAFVLRFGGTSGGSFYAAQSLFGWDGANWTMLNSGGPGPLQSAVMWPMANATFLFGGSDSTGALLADTWRWDSGGWVQLAPAASPPARSNTAAAFHSSQGHALMFGGATTTALYGGAGDTWKFDGTSWQQLTVGPAPGARRHHTMAYDPVRDRVVMCGGINQAPWPSPSMVFSDTWEHDGTSWTQVLASGGPHRHLGNDSSMSMAFDETRQRIVAVATSSLGYRLWEYDGVTWSQLAVAGDQNSAHPLLAYSARADTSPGGNLVVTDIFGVMELLPHPSSAESYGSACTAAAPLLGASQMPDIGQASFAVEATLAPANGPIVIVAGDQSANQQALGCTLLVQPTTTMLMVADAQGFAAQPLTLPANPALLGGEFFFQAAVLDATAPAGISLSRGLRITLGE